MRSTQVVFTRTPHLSLYLVCTNPKNNKAPEGIRG